MPELDPTAANRAGWDERADLHASDRTGMYRIDTVLAGRSCLHPIETAVLGDVAGLRVAHLQCHIGLDTLSLAHLGAQPVGLDYSGKAVAAARAFAARSGRPDVTFVEADVYEARAALSGEFDLVYVTWGAINWLPDIRRWAAVVASLLRPGGRLFLAETHPSALCLEERDGRIEPAYDWNTPAERPLAFDTAQSYTGDDRPLTHTRSYEWIHPLSEIIGVLTAAGMTIEHLGEDERLVYKLFPRMVPADLDPEGHPMTFRLPDGHPRLPLSFTLWARRSA